jgi:hypothetical protein
VKRKLSAISFQLSAKRLLALEVGVAPIEARHSRCTQLWVGSVKALGDSRVNDPPLAAVFIRRVVRALAIQKYADAIGNRENILQLAFPKREYIPTLRP